MDRFAGTRVLLTGGASGIGRATAVRLAGEGAAVFAVDRSAGGLDGTVAEAATAGGPPVVPHAADVTDEAAVIAAVRAAAAALGGIDVLVNVAGIHRAAPAAELTVADLNLLFSVNLVGTALFCREALPHLPDGSGVIVNVASSAATQGTPYMSAYAASKGAVLSFSLSLAAELAPRRIRVVPLCPGGVDTPLTRGGAALPEGVDLEWFSRMRAPLGIGRPEQIAGAIAFAASGDGGYLTGTELRVDGGAQT